MTWRHNASSSVIGTLQKTPGLPPPACAPCQKFRDDDPDLYYCTEHRKEFPTPCSQFQPVEAAEVEGEAA